ncbi:MAG: response regulator [Deltaproteobacteria bacterium]|nr:response regulator [Deltaproteobacteria bacterium]MBW1957005.1 response regulator [Deltaproteobacteria bacterium]MBW2013560.1 response regulator [Deltaproteobacteria bacterium]MBW2087537.1 response regulator [Deltaproteobacteria bacterium]MBW2319268.1 response regulator [Deltaproteobacteria bacterium]
MNPVNIPNVKIAVIDDDLMVRDFVVTVLMYCVNRDVLSFDSGLDAWRYIEDYESPDIIISEIDVPGLNGFELMAKFREKSPGKKCLLMSDNPANEQPARNSGADAFLAKPVRVNDLFEVVQNFVVRG